MNTQRLIFLAALVLNLEAVAFPRLSPHRQMDFAAMNTMRSISSGDLGEYLESLITEDYMQDCAERPGFLIGGGVEALGLEQGTVLKPGQLTNLLLGLNPAGDTVLVEAQGGKRRRPGHEFQFTSPKAPSVHWALGLHPKAEFIPEAFIKALVAHLRHFEATIPVVRRGKGGRTREFAKLIFAVHLHHTSREGDPQIHAHVIIPNVAMASDGKWLSTDMVRAFKAKKMLGIRFLNKFKEELHALGIETIPSEKYDWAFDLATPPGLNDLFSKRRSQILKELERLGRSDSRTAQLAALSTRRPKEAFKGARLPDLQEMWRSEALANGFVVGHDETQRKLATDRERHEPSTEQLVDTASEALAEEHGAFQAEDLHGEAQRVGLQTAHTAEALEGAVEEALRSKLVRLEVPIVLGHQEMLQQSGTSIDGSVRATEGLGDNAHEERTELSKRPTLYTTRREQERRSDALAQLVAYAARSSTVSVNEDIVRSVLGSRDLSFAQSSAVVALGGARPVKVLIGTRAELSPVVDAATLMWQASNVRALVLDGRRTSARLVGFALRATVKEALAGRSLADFVESLIAGVFGDDKSIAKLLRDLSPSAPPPAIVRVLVKMWVAKKTPHVLVVEDAAALSRREFERVVRAAKECRAKLVLLGPQGKKPRACGLLRELGEFFPAHTHFVSEHQSQRPARPEAVGFGANLRHDAASGVGVANGSREGEGQRMGL